MIVYYIGGPSVSNLEHDTQYIVYDVYKYFQGTDDYLIIGFPGLHDSDRFITIEQYRERLIDLIIL